MTSPARRIYTQSPIFISFLFISSRLCRVALVIFAPAILTDFSLATGVIVASGPLGQIIPPSIVLVVLGDQLGVSVGDLFLGSLIPGIMMASAFAIYVLVISILKPELAPQGEPIHLSLDQYLNLGRIF